MKDNQFDFKLLHNLPSPFYRVTVKALIFDEQNRLLVGRGEETDDKWEMPGGGWEHNESLEECLTREIDEELGAEIKSIGKICFVYRGKSSRGWMIVRIAVAVELISHNFKYGDMTEIKWATKDELLGLEFAADEGTIKNEADKLWPNF
jgi:ADP-ribose pyrophosphatase YjhB (NUDIX family)